MAVALPLLTPIAGSLLTFACMMPVYYMGFQIHVTRPLIPMEFSLITILALYVIHILISYFKEISKKQKVIQVLGQYMPPELARQVRWRPRCAEARRRSSRVVDYVL